MVAAVAVWITIAYVSISSVTAHWIGNLGNKAFVLLFIVCTVNRGSMHYVVFKCIAKANHVFLIINVLHVSAL